VPLHAAITTANLFEVIAARNAAHIAAGRATLMIDDRFATTRRAHARRLSIAK